MMIEGFTPVSALVGGVLIGLAVTGLLLLLGRIAGVSGIVGGLLGARRDEISWRLLFLIGLVVGTAAHALARPEAAVFRLEASWPIVIAGGLLVGFGTRLGSGCTSGHGVCGLARLSRRSLVATAVFMATAVATVFVVRHAVAG